MDVLKAILAGLHSGQIQLAVNKQSKNGWSPLIVAASKGHVEAVKVNYNTSLKKVLKIFYSRSALNISYSVIECEFLNAWVFLVTFLSKVRR